MKNILPTFLIPGAGKSGTTYISEMLSTHPEVFFSKIKEPAFFSTYKNIGLYHVGLPFYHKHFHGYGGEKHVGEASTVYMYDPISPHLIKKHIPDVKLIFILRNPTERVYSNYWQDIKSGKRHQDFKDMLIEGHERIKEMIYVSRYDLHIKRYFSIFDRKQIKIWLYDDLKRDPIELLNGIRSFLGLAPFKDGTNFGIKANPPSTPRSKTLTKLLANQRLLRAVKAVVPPSLSGPLRDGLQATRNLAQKPFYYPDLDEESRLSLRKEFRVPIEELSSLVGRDLSMWMEGTN